jgi:parallel beta-helix repeat protein
MPARPRLVSLLLLACATLPLLGVATCRTSSVIDDTGYVVVPIAPGPGFEDRVRAAFLAAKPGQIIELPAGTFAFTRSLTLESSHVILRGQGMYATVLDFTGQIQGAQGILARGDQFAAQDLAVINPAGDGIKTEFIDGVTFERVRVEWTAGPHPDNGDYGLYPAQCENVLVTDSIVRGARDAGIYVGQSRKVVVRNSLAEWNVLGIEIENSQDADVYGNFAVHNTGGIAIFNLPNLQVDGIRVRAFDNFVVDNDTENFAAGGILSKVPPGSGILVIGHDQVEVFGNRIFGNDAVNLGIADFQIALETITDPDYDPWTEGVHVHDNEIHDGGGSPLGGVLGVILSGIFARESVPIPDIVVGGWVDPAKLPGGVIDPAIVPPTLQVLPANKICLHDNPGASFGSVNAFGNGNGLSQPYPLLDPSPHDCTHDPLAAAVLDPPTPIPPDPSDGYSPEEIAQLCHGAYATPGDGVNWAAFVVPCPVLSDYRLFTGGDPRSGPNENGQPFELTMALFSDYASKYRFFFVPPGQSVQYAASDVFDFPVGTIIAKTFTFQNALAGTEAIVETRLLIRRASGWEGLPYIWNYDASEAYYTPEGAVQEVSVTGSDGVLRTSQYSIPSTTDCHDCHLADVPIGPKARYLNRDNDFGAGPENQLDHWTAIGLLAGAPDSSTIPALPGLDALAAPNPDLEGVARSYLEINCAHCHNPDGRAGFTGLHLTHDHPLDTEYGLCKRPVAAGSGAGDLLYDIVPGRPDESIMVFRLASTEPEIKMPEIEKGLVHDEGVDLLRAWISSLPGECVDPEPGE